MLHILCLLKTTSIWNQTLSWWQLPTLGLDNGCGVLYHEPPLWKCFPLLEDMGQRWCYNRSYAVSLWMVWGEGRRRKSGELLKPIHFYPSLKGGEAGNMISTKLLTGFISKYSVRLHYHLSCVVPKACLVSLRVKLSPRSWVKHYFVNTLWHKRNNHPKQLPTLVHYKS